MSASAAFRRLTTFLYMLAGLLFATTILELLAAKHYGGPMQLVPFGLCALGLLSLVALRRRPSPRSVMIIRVLMIVIVAGSLLGIYEHVAGNLEFVHETRRHADTITVIKDALQGRDPILAPGVLALGAALTLAVSWARRVAGVDEPGAADHRNAPADIPTPRPASGWSLDRSS